MPQPLTSAVGVFAAYQIFNDPLLVCDLDLGEKMNVGKQSQPNSYVAPRQPRAVESENRFLEAAARLVAQNGYSRTSLEEIAELAGLQKGALLKRFGSKSGIIQILFDDYCDEANSRLELFRREVEVGSIVTIDDLIFQISSELERFQRKHFAANRAFNEILASNMEIAESAAALFGNFVRLLAMACARFLDGVVPDTKTLSTAAQILVSLNYNYVLGIAPGLAREDADRHRFIMQATKALMTLESR